MAPLFPFPPPPPTPLPHCVCICVCLPHWVSQVTRIAAQLQARAVGASTVTTQTEPVFGVPQRDPPFAASALVEFEYMDVPLIPRTNTPPQQNTTTHGCVTSEWRGQMQVQDFLNTGVVQQYCTGGPCVSQHCPAPLPDTIPRR
jgi:hypothetical protein